MTVELIDPVPGLPDLVFTANAGLVFHDRVPQLAVPLRRPAGRDAALRRAGSAAHGFAVVHLPEGMYFEGAGDALFCGETLFAGYRFRSDARSHQWVGEQLGVEVLPLELVDPRFYHLDTCFCPLATGRGDLLPRRLRRLRPVGPARPHRRPDRGRGRGGGLVQLQRRGRRPDGGAERRCAEAGRGPCERPATTSARVLLTEFIKAGGSAKCLTLRLDGEEAATWKTHPDVAGSAA